jgi:hypothetical protein
MNFDSLLSAQARSLIESSDDDDEVESKTSARDDGGMPSSLSLFVRPVASDRDLQLLWLRPPADIGESTDALAERSSMDTTIVPPLYIRLSQLFDCTLMDDRNRNEQDRVAATRVEREPKQAHLNRVFELLYWSPERVRRRCDGDDSIHCKLTEWRRVLSEAHRSSGRVLPTIERFIDLLAALRDVELADAVLIDWLGALCDEHVDSTAPAELASALPEPLQRLVHMLASRATLCRLAKHEFVDIVGHHRIGGHEWHKRIVQELSLFHLAHVDRQ